ncbi:MAG TPA: glycerate kinase [Bacillota bacterium]|nr:glycerate kinase [Bacillota bacterium]
MKIVVAPDSFKGSMTATHAAEVMKRGILAVQNDCHVLMKPMADGGEGTLDTLLLATKGERIPVVCTGPLGEKITTSYGMTRNKTAIIECANIAGLTLVPNEMRNPDLTTTYGIGEVMKDALDRGCTAMIIGLGGSATNDGGLGMLQALGLQAWDACGNVVGPFGSDLLTVRRVTLEGLDKRLSHIDIKVARDVDYPLCGPDGASAVFGPQKGATPEQVKVYDQALQTFGQCIEKEIDRSFMNVRGAGAAGGLGFSLLVLGARLVSGAQLIAQAAQLEDAIQGADFVLTGEGKSDEQTLYGKAPHYVAELATHYGVPVVLLSGSLAGDLEGLRKKFSGCFSIINEPLSLEKAMQDAEQLLFSQTKQVIHFWNSIRKKG